MEWEDNKRDLRGKESAPHRDGHTARHNEHCGRSDLMNGCFSCALPDYAAWKKPQRKPDMIQLPLPDLDENQRQQVSL